MADAAGANRLVSAFQRVSLEEADLLNRANHATKVAQSSPRWEIHYAHPKELILLPAMGELQRQIAIYAIPPQALLIFESSGEAYVAVCLANLALEILKVAALGGSEKAFALVSQIASKG